MIHGKRIPFIIAVCGLGVMLNYVNCGRPARFSQRGPVLENTIAGNPMIANKVAGGICEVVTRCHSGVSRDQCLAAVMGTSGFSAALGLPTNFSSLNSILQAETSGLLVGDRDAGNTCYQSIATVACTDPVAQAAYDAMSSTPYAGSTSLVDAANCENAVEPASQYSCSSQVFILGAANPGLNPPASATSNLTYSVSPGLPAGMSIDSLTGVISGTPTVVSPRTAYIVTAANASGTVSNTINIQTANGYIVNDLGDAPNTGGTNCSTAGGVCTLRAAIQASNSSSSRKAIVAPAGTVQLTSRSSLNISRGVDLYGNCEQGTVLDGLNATRVLSISAGPTSVERLTVQNGSTNNGAGSGIYIYANSGTYTTDLRNVVIRNNRNVGAASGMSNGAGLAAFGTSASSQAIVNLSDCEVSNNINAGNFGGGLGFWYHTVGTLNNCRVTGNSNTGYGGGLSTHNSVNVNNSVFEANSSDGEGGGIFIDQYAGGNSSISNSIFTSNTALAAGAIYFGANTVDVSGSTFTNNRSGTGHGGAIGGMGTRVNLQGSTFRTNYSGGSLSHCWGQGDNQVVSSGANNSDNVASDCNLTHTTDQVSQ